MSRGVQSREPVPDDGTSLLDAWMAAHANATRWRDEIRRRRQRMKGAIALGIGQVVAVGVLEPLAIQAAQGGSHSLLEFGPYVVPMVGVVGAYFSFRTAFLEHRRHAEAEVSALRVEMEKKVAHEVLDAHLHAIRSDVGEVKSGLNEVRDSLRNLSIDIGRLQGRRGGAT